MALHASLDQCIEAFRRQIESRSPENSCKKWYHHALKALVDDLNAIKGRLPREQQDMLTVLQINLINYTNAEAGVEQAQPWHEMSHALGRLIEQYQGADREACLLSVRKIMLCAQKQHPYLRHDSSQNTLFGHHGTLTQMPSLTKHAKSHQQNQGNRH